MTAAASATDQHRDCGRGLFDDPNGHLEIITRPYGSGA
jgi:hypothetical protein